MSIINSYISNTQLFHDLKSMGRDNFSYDGAKALMEYLEELSEDIGENIEYDPIAFCCDFSEYSSATECAVDTYNFTPELLEADDDEIEAEALEYLRDNTTVIEFDGGVIVQGF